jgi:hypothetical protein
LPIAKRHRGLGADRIGELLHFGVELIERHDAIHQAAPLRLGGIDEVAGQQHFHGLLAAHGATQRD